MLRDRSLIPLSHHHQHGLALCVMIERGLCQDASAENVAKFARKAIDMYDLELTNHFEIEEGFVFPAIEPHPLVADLIGQHRRLEGLIARLRREPSSELLLEFAELLRTHIRREENELFQDIQKCLPRETLDRLGKEIDAKAVRICL
jgi:hemerythrin-like domain-containing protein